MILRTITDSINLSVFCIDKYSGHSFIQRIAAHRISLPIKYQDIFCQQVVPRFIDELAIEQNKQMRLRSERRIKSVPIIFPIRLTPHNHSIIKFDESSIELLWPMKTFQQMPLIVKEVYQIGKHTTHCDPILSVSGQYSIIRIHLFLLAIIFRANRIITQSPNLVSFRRKNRKSQSTDKVIQHHSRPLDGMNFLVEAGTGQTDGRLRTFQDGGHP